MCPDVPYFIIWLCLMPDNFTWQEENAASQWVNPIDILYTLDSTSLFISKIEAKNIPAVTSI